MYGPSNSRRKRPLDAMAGATIGDAVDTRSTCNDDVMVNQKNISFTSSCNVYSAGRDGEGRNNVYCDLSERSDCSDTEEDECIPEILDLQKALEYLVSERDIEHAYNNYGDTQKQHTAQSHTKTATDTNDNDTGASKMNSGI